MISLSQLVVYPVKSLGGYSCEKTEVTDSGLARDRQWMLTLPNGEFITARHYPQLVRFSVQTHDDGITITAPDHRLLRVYFRDVLSTPEVTIVWHAEFTSFIASIGINRWFSHYLGQDVQLRWLGPHSNRRLKRYPHIPLSFADSSPFLLINQASYDYVQAHCPATLNMARFRPNLVINGAAPFEEDTWKTIQIGEVVFDLVKPCSRCILTTVHPNSGEKHPDNEPLKTLQLFRQAENGDIDFGQHMIAQQKGTIQIGDTVTILQTQSAKKYTTQTRELSARHLAQETRAVRIDFDGDVFIGNNQMPLLDQLEAHGAIIPYFCRSGTCGACQLMLLDGEVEVLNRTERHQNGRIRCCSCIPKTDIRVKRIRE